MYQPKTGQKCGCRQGIQRDNCPNCEGTGWVIDFRAIRERIAVKQAYPTCPHQLLPALERLLTIKP